MSPHEVRLPIAVAATKWSPLEQDPLYYLQRVSTLRTA